MINPTIRILLNSVAVLLPILITACAVNSPVHNVASDYRLEVLVPGSAMHGVHGLAFDKDDVLYGASLAGYSIYQIDTVTGEVTTKVGPPLGNADDVAVAPDGTLAWTAGAYSAVHALTPEGEFKVLAEGLPAVNSINYSPDGRLFVTRVFGGDALYEVDPQGEAEPRLIAKKLGGLNGFEVTADHQLYGPLFLKGKLVQVDVDSGEVTQLLDGFTVPAAVNLDSQGRLFVVDFKDGTVSRINLDLLPSPSAREIIARLEPPLDNLAINSHDEVYVSNPATNTITAVDPDTGATRTVVSGNLSTPGGIALASIDGVQVLLVADFWGNRYFDINTGARTMLELPAGVTASSSIAAYENTLALASIWPFGLVYVIDQQANKIVKTAKFAAPYSPVFMGDGSLLIADYSAGTVTRLAPGKSRDKTVVASGLEGPVGLALANEYTLYISEYDGGRVLRLNLSTLEQSIVVAGLEHPEGLAITRDGQVLVAETGTQRLLRIDPTSWVVDTIADNLAIGLAAGSDLPAPFLPTGIAVDAADNIYVSADIDNALYKLVKQ
jgi:sugar lactone lactonase YvrE